jgi:outer membrane protein assembly factor BamB
MWFTTNRCEVVCLDVGPLKRGATEPRVVWKVDMMKQFGVFPRCAAMGLFHTSSVAVYNDLIFVNTGNGIDEGNTKVPAPEAPSVVCFKKDTGAVVWHDNSPGANILVGQWSSPLVIEVNDRAQVVAAQGDGWLRSFDAATGKLIWKFDINPKAAKWSLDRGTRNYFMASPVYYGGRIFIASGQESGFQGIGRLVCIDPTMTGDISSELVVEADGQPATQNRIQAVDLEKGQRVIPNPNSGLNWEYTRSDKNGDGKIEFDEGMNRTYGNVAIKGDLLIAADHEGIVYCLDVKSGKLHWSHDCLSHVFASPLIVGDKVYIGDQDGNISIFRLTAEAHEPVAEINMGGPVYASPIFAHGTLYVATSSHLFAIASVNAGESESPVAGGSWPQWRGPNRDNKSPETGLLKEWPEAGPPLLWWVEGIGEGIATVSIDDGRIFTLGYFDDGEFLTALDQHTVRRLWTRRIGPRVNESPLMRWLSHRSPTIDGDRIYVINTAGRLTCLQTRNGQEFWSKSYPDDFASPRPPWGFCDYPLVDGDRLVCTPGGPDASVVAFDKRTGAEVWRTVVPEGGPSSYAAVVVAELGGVRQYVAFLSGALVGLRSSDGELLWRYEKLVGRYGNTQTPIVHGDHLLVGGPLRGELALLKFAPCGESVDLQEQYFEKARLDNFQDNSLLVGDYLYSCAMFPTCVDWKSGKTIWATRTKGMGRGAMVYADDRLYLRHSDGRVALADVSPNGYVERGSFLIPDHKPAQGATSPIIAGGRLYLRDDDKLFCYDIRDGSLKHPLAVPRTIVLTAPGSAPAGEARERTLRSVFVPTPQDVVEKMLQFAEIKETDIVYDLGSGDGRIVITAARKYGSRAVGYEIDAQLVETSRANAEAAGVQALVSFEEKDLFTADLSGADVVAVYLLPKQLEKLRPQLEKLKPGSRIVSHQFEIPGIKPDKTLTVESADDDASHTVYRWTAPLHLK